MEDSLFPEICAIDGLATCRYIIRTSLLFVSTAGRGAASSGAALAFCAEAFLGQGVAT